MLKTALWFFGIGVIVAITIELVWWTSGYYTPQAYAVERVARIFWPTSVFKMVLSEQDSSIVVIVVNSISFVANGVVYGIVGFVLALSKKLLKQRF
jgi:hypothetical protein